MYVLWDVYLPNAVASHIIKQAASIMESYRNIYNGANSPNGFLTPAVV